MDIRNPIHLFVFGVMVFILSACASSSIKDTEQAEAGPAEFEQVIELEREVHFLTPTGENVVVLPGTYSVEAGDAALRLIPDDEQTTQPITIQAESTTHEESLESAQQVSTSMDPDKHVVALLLPDGKAMQAIGSYSGVHPRGSKLNFNWMKGLKIPTINAILTTPKLGAITPGGKLYIKGKHFGSSKGKIILHGSFWVAKKTALTIERWSPTKITATVPRQTLGKNIRDQQTKLQILSSKGVGGGAWKIRFRASRQGIWLKMTDKAVKVVSCSTGADVNACNGKFFSDEAKRTKKTKKALGAIGCGARGGVPTWKNRTPAIYSQHANCDVLVDWDEGTDRYIIRLKNGWVFKEIKLHREKTSSSEKITMPSYRQLNRSVVGTSSWSPKISWEISPGPDRIYYGFYVRIEGPRGIPHY